MGGVAHPVLDGSGGGNSPSSGWKPEGVEVTNPVLDGRGGGNLPSSEWKGWR